MNTLKLYFRNLTRQKAFSFVTIGSFSASLAIIIILASFLISEYGYDHHIKEINQIYRVASSKNDASVPEKARMAILENLPQVESATNYATSSEPLTYNGESYTAKVIHTDEGIFSVLPIDFVTGNRNGIFDDKRSVVITQVLAKRIFGNDNPIGKSIIISHSKEVIVAGIINEFPEKSTLRGDLLCSSELKVSYSSSCYNDECTYFYKLLIKLHPNSNVSEVESKITAIVPKIPRQDSKIYSLHPLKNAYFDTTLTYDSLEHANVKLIQLLLWLTGILLVLSVFNYINLAAAQSLTRLKEFGMKKALGLNHFSLTINCISEALITALIAFSIGSLLSIVIKPVFEGMLGKEIALNNLFQSPLHILTSLLCLIIIAIVSALYPAQIALRSNAKDLMSKKLNGSHSGETIRNLFNTVQFAASIAIIISLTVISRQVDYVKTKNFGFSTAQLVRIPVHWDVKNKVDVVTEKFSSLPSVISVCHSHGTPGDVRNSSADENGSTSMITSDDAFTQTFGLAIIQGRNLLPNESSPACLINKKAMMQQGWDNIEGKKIFGQNVVGLLDDFHYEDMYNKIGALMIENGKDVSHFTVRIRPENIPGAIEQLRGAFTSILPDHEFSYEFYNEYLAGMYKQEEKRASALKIVSLIALFISCIGLYGLVDLSIKSRVKEIGIRKVNGAKISEVLVMLNQDFVVWVVVAYLIATPIAYYAMNKWLENFAYKTELSWWIFALAGLLALGIALLTVSWQSWRAATRNPVESLRYE